MVNKIKIGSIISMIGATLMIGLGLFILLVFLKKFEVVLNKIGISWNDLGHYKTFFRIYGFATLTWGIIGIIGSILGIKKYKTGSYLQILAGILAVVGMYWTVYPDQRFDFEWGYITVSGLKLSGVLIYIDPYMMLIGGMIGIFSNITLNKLITFYLNYKKISGILLITLGFLLMGIGIFYMLREITLLYLTFLPYTLGLFLIILGKNQYRKE